MTDGAAPQAAVGGDARALAEVSEALRALRLAWGDTYEFGHDQDGYRAERPGGARLRAGSPEELGALLAADFEADLP